MKPLLMLVAMRGKTEEERQKKAFLPLLRRCLSHMRAKRPESSGAMSAHGTGSSSLSFLLLVFSRPVVDDNQTHNLAVANGTVVRQDEISRGKIGFVVLAVVGTSDDDLPIVVDHFTHLHRHLIA